jgi:hypothetical protein
MLKDYYYRLLSKYISIYARSGEKVLFVEPKSRVILSGHSGNNVLIVTNNPERFSGYTTAQEIRNVKEWEPDYIILEGLLQYKADIIDFLNEINSICTPSTKVILTYYSMLWKPIMGFATLFGLRERNPRENWITPADLSNFARLTDLERVKRQPRVLMPLQIPFLSDFINRWMAPLPLFNIFCLINFEILRPIKARTARLEDNSVSVIIPVRNEVGNIEAAFERIPIMGPDDELIFIEGNSTDNTWEELQRCRDKYAPGDSRNIKIAQQEGKGKKDAVYKGFSLAKNNILMILDGDLTVPPEDLPKFYNAITSNKGEFINGCRLIYSLEDDAMRFLNMIGNKFFAFAFSYVLSQDLRDTLCGTKVFTRRTYERIQKNRSFFGDFDPFGDFDLIFGADRIGLKVVEVPVRYQARTYGDTNIRRFRHGLLLLKMLLFVCRKLKFV